MVDLPPLRLGALLGVVIAVAIMQRCSTSRGVRSLHVFSVVLHRIVCVSDLGAEWLMNTDVRINEWTPAVLA